MGKPNYIELGDGTRIPVLFEDRSAMIIDKPRGWLLAPTDWRTTRNLQAALEGSIFARDFWARSRNLKFLRYVHRLDAETTGLLLLAKSPGAVRAYNELFAGRDVSKSYLAVVHGQPKQERWTCHLNLSDAADDKLVRVDKAGKPAQTNFRVLMVSNEQTLVEAQPLTGRTHQIRVHLASAGLPIVGDTLYGRSDDPKPLALRAMELAYRAPFTGQQIHVRAPADEFLIEFGFPLSSQPSGSRN